MTRIFCAISLTLMMLCTWAPADVLFQDGYNGPAGQSIELYDSDYALPASLGSPHAASMGINGSGDALRIELIDNRDAGSESITTSNSADFTGYSVGIDDGKAIYLSAKVTLTDPSVFQENTTVWIGTQAVGQGASGPVNNIRIGLIGTASGVAPFASAGGGNSVGTDLVAGTYLLVARYSWYTESSWANGSDELVWAINPAEESELSGAAVGPGNPQDPGGAAYSQMQAGAELSAAWRAVGALAEFDDVTIATTYAEAIPEPATLSVMAIAAVGLFRRRRK